MRRALPSFVLFLTLVVLFLTLVVSWAGAQTTIKPRKERRDGRYRQNDAAALPAEITDLRALSLVLGRPTDRSIVVSVLSADDREGYLEYGPDGGHSASRTDLVKLPAGTPVDLLLNPLDRNVRYFYRLQHRKHGDSAFTASQEHSFHTQRLPGNTFLFEIQGDSHPERPHENDPALYAQTLRSAAADRPDFYMAIGDDFSVDTLRTISPEAVNQIYLNQRCFLGLVAHSSPLFLVNGNHEQAAACNLDGTPNNVAVWAQNARNRFFPQPTPNGFYTGDATEVPFIGPLRDYFAWTWGDALFVVIDPYWHSPKPVDAERGGVKQPHRDLWNITLGDEQYRWFKKTLESSKARHKFVFIHHVLGTGRGGIENANLFEWGGQNRRGDREFEQKRPGWELPIHPLMAKSGVTVFFQGHDHLFARQQLDGVVYQTLPEPADPNYAFAKWASGYRSGDLLPNSGRVRITVGPDQVTVEYLRSWLSKDETGPHKDGEVAFRYSIPAKTQDHISPHNP
jgi:hypothetical protein